MFRHHDITDQLESMPGTYFLEDSGKSISSACRSKKWETSITTEGNEVQIAAATVAS